MQTWGVPYTFYVKRDQAIYVIVNHAKKKQRRAQLHVHQKWKCFVTLIWHRILSNKCYKFSFIDMETANEHNEDSDFGNGTWEEQDSQCGMH